MRKACWASRRGARMRERQLGATDLRVSPLGLGCNNFGGRLDAAAARNVVHAALDTGITVFDTADIYGNRGGSETILGEALGARRKDIVLITKFGVAMDDEGKLKGGSARYVASAIEASLKRLQDRLDRSLLLPSSRSGDAARGNAARARRAHRAGQGALHRLFEHVGCADRGGATGLAGKRLASFCGVPGPIQSAVAPDRGRDHSGDSRASPWR